MKPKTTNLQDQILEPATSQPATSQPATSQPATSTHFEVILIEVDKGFCNASVDSVVRHVVPTEEEARKLFEEFVEKHDLRFRSLPFNKDGGYHEGYCEDQDYWSSGCDTFVSENTSDTLYEAWISEIQVKIPSQMKIPSLRSQIKNRINNRFNQIKNQLQLAVGALV